jgi:regulator of sigma E protease
VIMFMTGAPVELPGAEIVAVERNSPASDAGLEVGDIIMKADDVEISSYDKLTAHILQQTEENPGDPIALTIQRGGETLTLDVVPRAEPPEGQGPTGIQVQSIIEVRRYSPIAAVGESLNEMWTYTKAFVELPIAAIKGIIPARYIRPVSPVGISELGGQALQASIDQNQAWPIIQITAVISLALAVTNLLPLPALDGGRILFVLIEAVRGRRVDPQRETMVHLIGFAILLTTMLVFVYLDIVDPLVPR